MSSRPNATRASDDQRAPLTLPQLRAMKAAGEPVVMVTAYDYPSAVAAEHAGVDIALVGDSGAMTVLGYDSTVPATVDNPDLYRGARGGAFVASTKIDWLAAYAEKLQTAKSPLGLLTRMPLAAE